LAIYGVRKQGNFIVSPYNNLNSTYFHLSFQISGCLLGEISDEHQELYQDDRTPTQKEKKINVNLKATVGEIVKALGNTTTYSKILQQNL